MHQYLPLYECTLQTCVVSLNVRLSFNPVRPSQIVRVRPVGRVCGDAGDHDDGATAVAHNLEEKETRIVLNTRLILFVSIEGLNSGCFFSQKPTTWEKRRQGEYGIVQGCPYLRV